MSAVPCLNENGQAIVSINDNPDLLIGKKLNVFLYRDENGYYRILQRIAPANVFKNTLEQMTENDIDYWKQKAEYYFNHFVESQEVAAKATEKAPF